MSVEKIFDKLDDKISSLLRSIGIIITLLFGIFTLILNYFPFDIIINYIIIILLTLFLINIIYTLYLYVFESVSKDRFIQRLDSHHQVSKLTRNLYQEIIQKLDIASHYYFEAQSRQSFNLSEIYGRIETSFEKFKSTNKEEEIIEIRFNNIKVFRDSLLGFIDAFILINNYVSDLLDIENLHFREMNNLIEMMRIFENDLSRYENLELEIDFTRTFATSNIYFAFENCLLHFRTGIDVAYSKINEDKIDVIKSYEKKIKVTYILFGLIIIFACTSFFLIAISIFFPSF